jgi:L-alanine-DL-glutamate epimerase-like enolase superfamily enzyme
MKITRVEVYGYELTYAFGTYVMSGGQVVESLASTVVRLVTDAGIDGWGEVCPLGQLYLEAHAGGARAALEVLAPAVVGIDPTNIAAVNLAMDRALKGHRYAKSPVDVACWDVLGKACGQPVTTLLGGRLQESYPLYKAVPLGPPEQMAEYVRARKAEGIASFQVKIGADPYEDAERVHAVAAVTDSGDRLICDANGGYRLQDAIIAARLLEPLERVYYEQPCATLEECLYVRRHTTLPMILDEVITDTGSLLRAWEAGGMEALNLKISRFGGLTGAKLVRDLAARLGLRLTIEDTWGGDLVTAAVSHLAASTPQDALFTVSFMNDWTNEHIAGYQPRSHDAIGAAPDAPGLGVEVDRDMLGEPLFVAGA